MKLFVLSSGYPDPGGSTLCGFVHARCLEYVRLGAEVRVIVYYGDPREYVIDGIPVRHAPMDEIFRVISQDQPDACAVHFPIREFCEAHDRHRPGIPFGLWFHGMETLSWMRRLFNFSDAFGFFKYAWHNSIQLRVLRTFLLKNGGNRNVRLVYVSEWMHRIAEADLGIRIPDYRTIPNPIDCEHFAHHPKSPEQRFDVLLLRSFDSRKYANDISVDAIRMLSRTAGKDFARFRFRIFGKGRHFKELTSKLVGFPNVSCEERYFPREEIPAVHRGSGVFLCPTRQDAQGVSMCEAMASGLVPVTSLNTAIPEFVTHEKDGLLARSAAEVADALLRLAREPEFFMKLSAGAAGRMRSQCEGRSVAKQEMALLFPDAAS